MHDQPTKKEVAQKQTIFVLSAVIVALVIVIIVLIVWLPFRSSVTHTSQTQPTAPVINNQATTTSAGSNQLQSFINTAYGYELLYPSPMSVTAPQGGSNPTTSGLVSFNGAAVGIPSFTVSASTDTTQSNNNGSLVCEKFVGGNYTAFPVGPSIFYYGTVATQQGSFTSYCTIHQGIKYLIYSSSPATQNGNELLRSAVSTFKFLK